MRSTSERISLANPAIDATPTAMATLIVPKPSAVMIARESRSPGKRQQHVDDAHADLVHDAADESGDQTHRGTHDQGDGDGEQGGLERERCSIHDPGVQVTPELIGAEQMGPARRLQLVLGNPDRWIEVSEQAGSDAPRRSPTQ